MNKNQTSGESVLPIHHVIPKPMLSAATKHMLVSGLYCTEISCHSLAQQPYRRKESAADQNILVICTEGKGWFRINGERKEIARNQSLLIARGLPFEYGSSPRDAWSILWLHFAGEDAAFYPALLKDDYTLKIHADIMPQINALFSEGCHALEGEVNQQTIIYLAQVVRHILGCLFFNNKSFSPNARTGTSRNLGSVIQFMKDHTDAAITINQMANKAGLSVTHFSRLFRQQTGRAPVEYFIRLKIQQACRFLTVTPLTVKEISSQLGYTDQYYFSRLFHKVMGISPIAYRRSQSV